MSGHQYHAGLRQLFFKALEHAEPIRAAHNDIAEDCRPVSLAQHLKGLLGGLSLANLPALIAKYVAHKPAHLLIVVNYQSLHKNHVPSVCESA